MRSQVLGVIFMALGLMACGTGVEPLSILGNPSQSGDLGLSLPITTPLTGFTAYGVNGSDGFDLSGNTWALLSQPLQAPGRGVVTAVDVSGQTVTIFHNANISSRIRGINSSVIVGSTVQASQQIGTNASTVIHFTVLYKGSAVCPLSYLSSTARTQFLTTIYSSYSQDPCQN